MNLFMVEMSQNLMDDFGDIFEGVKSEVYLIYLEWRLNNNSKKFV